MFKTTFLFSPCRICSPCRLCTHDLVAFKGLSYFNVRSCCPLLRLVPEHTSDAQCGLVSLCQGQSLWLAQSPYESEDDAPSALPPSFTQE